MTLASILYPAPTDKGLEEFFWANFQHHQAIISALKATRGIALEQFQIYPVNPERIDGWLEQHQKQHNAMNAALGIPGADLSSVDFKNKRELDSWLFAHELQHQAAGQLCGQPI